MRLAPFLLVFVAAMAAQVHHGGENPPHPHHRRSAAEWERVLENPERDAWQKPDEVVAALDLRPGQTVADIGAGSGYFAVRLARAVGPEGKVYAADIQQDLIDLLAQRKHELRLPSLHPVLGEPDDPKLPDGAVDLVFLCDVLHHIEGRPAYYAKLRRALAPGGRIAIVDFHKRELPVGPGVAMKIAREEAVAELARAGFALAAEHDFLPYQYFLVFEAR